MPWKTVTPMEEIARFVLLAQSGRFTFTHLCEQFGVSRRIGYKHLERFAAEGLKGLHRCPVGGAGRVVNISLQSR